ncbi:hypothetical protein Snov_2196 [Ancylobacter novellus DSM 506]|uniref:17 kDa surface antigen n=1 Tax=Ancylobacter novellus (strain ATCC 8093 / DSM 506 / JCM 20403 / CCM 1077 / IAM 12100 / NBRC 12443 / NCIMB 10456) TaxID=639283 RepID=D7A1D4_ANCN5|nr:hypothetical protein [Ancylobacter novellus]ADH89492.1 hypothetical protein Snov_2196 [Ancylobacter novellus DSM 506]
MRSLILALTLLTFGAASILPAAAQNQAPATVTPPGTEVVPSTSLSDSVPKPEDPDATDPYQIVAITVGAVGGIMVANMLTAGLATPAIAAAGGGGTMAAGAGSAMMASQIAVSAVGAVVGGYVGYWVYGN